MRRLQTAPARFGGEDTAATTGALRGNTRRYNSARVRAPYGDLLVLEADHLKPR
jgi:hypothetical protein